MWNILKKYEGICEKYYEGIICEKYEEISYAENITMEYEEISMSIYWISHLPYRLWDLEKNPTIFLPI